MAIEKKQLLKEMRQRYFEARKTKGLTQEDAAEIANVTKQAISDAELGKSFLSPYSILTYVLLMGLVVII